MNKMSRLQSEEQLKNTQAMEMYAVDCEDFDEEEPTDADWDEVIQKLRNFRRLMRSGAALHNEKRRAHPGMRAVALVTAAVMSVAAVVGTCSVPVYATDDNPLGNTIETLPSGEEMYYNYGTVETNEGKINNNQPAPESSNPNHITATVIVNNGSIPNNYGDVGTNNNSVTANYGTVGANSNNATVNINYGTVETNNGTVSTNGSTGNDSAIVETNNGTVGSNYRTVTTNNGTVNTNYGSATVTTNNGEVKKNAGTVTTNNGTVTNYGPNPHVITNTMTGTVTGGTVTDNWGGVVTDAQVVNNWYAVKETGQGECRVSYGMMFDSTHDPDYKFLKADASGNITVSAPEGYTISAQEVNDGDFVSIKSSDTNLTQNIQDSNVRSAFNRDGTTLSYSLRKSGDNYVLTITSLTGSVLLDLNKLNFVLARIGESSGGAVTPSEIEVEIEDGSKKDPAPVPDSRGETDPTQNTPTTIPGGEVSQEVTPSQSEEPKRDVVPVPDGRDETKPAQDIAAIVASGEVLQEVTPTAIKAYVEESIKLLAMQEALTNAIAQTGGLAADSGQTTGKAGNNDGNTANVPAVTINFGTSTDFTSDLVEALCSVSTVAKDAVFSYNGVQYHLYVPAFDPASEEFRRCLELLKKEKGGTAGFMRLAEIFRSLGFKISTE